MSGKTMLIGLGIVVMNVLGLPICEKSCGTSYRETFSFDDDKRLFIDGREIEKGVVNWDAGVQSLVVNGIPIYPFGDRVKDAASHPLVEYIVRALDESNSPRPSSIDSVYSDYDKAMDFFADLGMRLAGGAVSENHAMEIAEDFVSTHKLNYLVKHFEIDNNELLIRILGIGRLSLSPDVVEAPSRVGFEPEYLATRLRDWILFEPGPSALLVSSGNVCTMSGSRALELLEAVHNRNLDAIDDLLTKAFSRDFRHRF